MKSGWCSSWTGVGLGWDPPVSEGHEDKEVGPAGLPGTTGYGEANAAAAGLVAESGSVVEEETAADGERMGLSWRCKDESGGRLARDGGGGGVMEAGRFGGRRMSWAAERGEAEEIDGRRFRGEGTDWS
ncbi:hypothetical protein E2562_038946 [Oryza meyeriana var. granulata]|uniref:DUF834 domain-containing protein n=1 Tax=Oryza meyeriana var. granulata TaxID=110450 RepID=A0A6G1DD06_9ORYZ|nr:hypothetical protein E2562_038946 [Oryza meyeriana var. granulata]